jgi:2,3-bisphosphoglycerate-dependent phosphoglycerate mutase
MNTFYMVRHAHAVWSPDENRSLSKQGLENANHVAAILQHFPISLILSSPYLRARQTIAPLAGILGIDILIEPDLRERYLSNSSLGDFFTAVEKTWKDWSFAHPGGETNLAAQVRGVAVISELIDKNGADHIVLSTHGNLLALTLHHFDSSIDYKFWQALTMPDIYKLSFTPHNKVVIERLWQYSN